MRLEHVRIALHQRLLHLLAFLQMLLRITPNKQTNGVVFAVQTAAAVAENARREALAVQLQTPRFPAVARVLLPSN